MIHERISVTDIGTKGNIERGNRKMIRKQKWLQVFACVMTTCRMILAGDFFVVSEREVLLVSEEDGVMYVCLR